MMLIALDICIKLRCYWHRASQQQCCVTDLSSWTDKLIPVTEARVALQHRYIW